MLSCRAGTSESSDTRAGCPGRMTGPLKAARVSLKPGVLPGCPARASLALSIVLCLV